MFKRFISRTQRLAAKVLANNAMRIYIKNVGALQDTGFYANCRYRITTKPGRIEITLDKTGENKVFDTGRGELIELKNKSTYQALGNIRHVTVTYRVGKIIIECHASERAVTERNQRLFQRLKIGRAHV